MIDLQRLRILREVAEHGSFSGAAQALLLTPSAVSQQIAALERSLGTPVVERTTRGTTLTAPGRVLVESAGVVLAELVHAQQRISRLAEGEAERLTVATFISGGQLLLPRALTGFAAAHPRAEITVLEAETGDSLALVREGRADLALVYHFDGPPPVRAGDRSGLALTPLLDDPMRIVVPAAHPLAGRGEIDLADLAGERWVQGCVSVGDLLDGYAAIAGFEANVCCRTTDYGFAVSLIAAGVGIGLIPSVSLTAPPAGVSVLALRAPAPSRYISLVTRQGRQQPLVQNLVQGLLAVPGEMGLA
ncbi:LysR family transcriptional regulator [Catellatospora bangladeshensis]|uniref:LysR family transcriptional regulator n=1 Tax=Catellatospora bangladeshensis TaxID=310355 RepID=A0A8J3JMC2_9ACTN|nr:LysR family transcriptional regulator [Catellatospora bangladeshensis]GIF83281.1 LysR family transcriptional regulator [Catellatospora bangladeshensis]